jgi:hypothetical protein
MEMERLPIGQSLSDKQRAAHYKWVNMPPGLSPELASKFKLGLHGGNTIRDMTSADTDNYICSTDRFKKHCELNPDWWSESEAKLNVLNANKKKSANAYLANLTICKNGLHAMTPDNVKVATWGRQALQSVLRGEHATGHAFVGGN